MKYLILLILLQGCTIHMNFNGDSYHDKTKQGDSSEVIRREPKRNNTILDNTETI